MKKAVLPSVIRRDLRKHVGVVHSAIPLGIVERKLFNWLLYQSYEHLTSTETHELPLEVLRVVMGWEKSRNTDHLRTALETLVGTTAQFNLLNDSLRERWETAALLSYGAIEGGVVYWRYDKAMAQRLYRPEVFALLDLAQSQNLQSTFSYSLYEQIARFSRLSQTCEFALPVLRQLIGATAESYDEFRYFRQRVLTPAIDEINAITDLKVSMTFVRNGRYVAAVQFLIERNYQAQLLTPNNNAQVYSDAQMAILADLSRLGVSDKFARVTLDAHGVERLKAAITDVQRRVSSGLIKSSAAGYLRTVLESPLEQVASPLPTTVSRELPEAKRRAKEQESFVRESARERVLKLTPDETALLRQRFVELNPELVREWSESANQFSPKVAKQFQYWIRGNVTLLDSDLAVV